MLKPLQFVHGEDAGEQGLGFVQEEGLGVGGWWGLEKEMEEFGDFLGEFVVEQGWEGVWGWGLRGFCLPEGWERGEGRDGREGLGVGCGQVVLDILLGVLPESQLIRLSLIPDNLRPVVTHLLPSLPVADHLLEGVLLGQGMLHHTTLLSQTTTHILLPLHTLSLHL